MLLEVLKQTFQDELNECDSSKNVEALQRGTTLATATTRAASSFPWLPSKDQEADVTTTTPWPPVAQQIGHRYRNTVHKVMQTAKSGKENCVLPTPSKFHTSGVYLVKTNLFL